MARTEPSAAAAEMDSSAEQGALSAGRERQRGR